MREVYAGSLDQGDPNDLIVVLLDSSGDPVLGLTWSDINFTYLRSLDTSFQVYTLDAAKFFEISSGVYRIVLDSVIAAYIGNLRILLSNITIDNVLLRYAVVAGVPGNIQVTITIDDGAVTPFPSTQVDIWNDIQTLLLWSGITDINGQVVTSLNPGTYKVLLRRNRTAFTVPETLTVTGPTAETQTYSGAELSLTSPTSPDTCVIYGDVYDIDGSLDDQMSPDAIIIRAVRTRTPIYIGNKLLTIDPIDIRADQSGHFEITLIRGMQVTLDIPRIAWRKTFTVPSMASQNLVNIL